MSQLGRFLPLPVKTWRPKPLRTRRSPKVGALELANCFGCGGRMVSMAFAGTFSPRHHDTGTKGCWPTERRVP